MATETYSYGAGWRIHLLRIGWNGAWYAFAERGEDVDYESVKTPRFSGTGAKARAKAEIEHHLEHRGLGGT